MRLKNRIVIKIVFSKTASKNLITLAKYIFEQSKNEKIADRYLDDMKNFIIEILSHFPKSGRPSEELAPHTRKLVYKGYSIIYKIKTSQIDILVIFRENIPKL